MVIVNKYSKPCSVCGIWVRSGSGYAQSDAGKWLTYCFDHAPKDKIRRELTPDGRIYIQPWRNDDFTLSVLRVMPGRFYNKDGKYWKVSTHPKDRKEVIDLARRIALKIPKEWLADSPLEKAQNKGLYEYQLEGVDWLSNRFRAILGDEMGLGKSCQAIMAVEDNDPVLVVCPKIAKYTWYREFKKWRPDFNLKIISKRDSFEWPQPGEAVIINYDILPVWLAPNPNTRKVAWNGNDLWSASKTVLVCDEAHTLRGNKTIKHIKVDQLSKKTKKTWFLTGTPLVNHVKDLLSLLMALQMFRHTFGEFTYFVKKMGVPKEGEFHLWEEANPEEDVPAILSSVMLRRTREEVMDQIPSIQYQTLYTSIDDDGLVELLDGTWKDYKEFFEEKPDELPPFTEFSKVRERLANSRISAMQEFAENCELQDEPLVVFSAHRSPIEALEEREGWEVITGATPVKERDRIIEAFQSGKLAGIGLTIQAGGVSINLTRAATMLFVDLDWNPALNKQAEMRIDRPGQVSDNLRIIQMVSNHPLDLHVFRILSRKSRVVGKTLPTSALQQKVWR